MSNKNRLISVIGDEDTVTGFLLGGIGEQNKNGNVNFKICNKETPASEISSALKEFIARKDIAIILITQTYAELVRDVIELHSDPIPSILEIPSKESPYDVNKDALLRRAKQMFCSDD